MCPWVAKGNAVISSGAHKTREKGPCFGAVTSCRGYTTTEQTKTALMLLGLRKRLTFTPWILGELFGDQWVVMKPENKLFPPLPLFDPEAEVLSRGLCTTASGQSTYPDYERLAFSSCSAWGDSPPTRVFQTMGVLGKSVICTAVLRIQWGNTGVHCSGVRISGSVIKIQPTTRLSQ